MKQKKLFNLKLYLEGIRQIRTIGVLALVIQLIIGILIPVGNYLSEKTYYEEQLELSKTPIEIQVAVIDAPMSHIYLFILPIFAFFMVMMLFKFLNHREDCDFYHSIPHTRQCLFNSYGLAIITWLVGILTITGCVSCIFYKLFDKFLEISYGKIWGFSVNILVLSILISCVAMLACSICGNVMTTIVVFFILLLMPKIVMLVYFALLESVLPFLSQNILGIFAPENHLLFGMLNIMDFYASEEYAHAYPNSSTLYTFIVAAINYVIAMFAFTKRKSEAAGNAMSSDKLQSSFRTLFTSLICLIPIAVIFEMYIYKKMGDEFSEETMIYFSLVVSYIVAFVFMYIYELVTTKSARKAFRAFRSIPLVAGINVIILLILIISYNYHSNVRLDAKEIDSVSFSFDESYGYFNDYGNSDYFSAQMSSYKFTEDEIIQLLCDSYNQYAEDTVTPKTEEQEEYSTSYYDDYRYGNYYSEMHKVCFYGDKDYEFYVHFTSKALTELHQYFDQVPAIKEVYMNLPDIDNNDHLYYYENYDFAASLTDKEVLDIYSVLREELQSGTIDYLTWYGIFNHTFEEVTPFITLQLDLYENGQYYYLSLPVTSKTPKTLEYAWNLTLEHHKNDFADFQKTMDLFNDVYDADNNNESVYLSFNAVAVQDNEFTHLAWFDYYNDELYTKTHTYEPFQQLIPYAKPLSEFDETKDTYLLINFNYTVYDTYDEVIENLVVCVPKSALEEHCADYMVTE